jgi:hypothetical protein
MLLAYLYFISTILSSKNDAVSPLVLSASTKPSERNITFLDLNCVLDQILHVNDSKGDRHQSDPLCVETFIVRDDDMATEASTHEPPHHRLLNIDQALRILAFGAISKNDYRQLAYVLPEIRFWMEPYCLRIYGAYS